jgi:tetratricopeptide (TPR) repeat protein
MKPKTPDEPEEFDSEEEANEELKEDLAIEKVEARIEELGLIIPEDSEFTVNELQEIVALADSRPDSDALAILRAYGIALSKGTALEARMLVDLVEAYSTDRWEDKLPRTSLAAVCAVALKDPAVYQVAFYDEALERRIAQFPPEAQQRLKFPNGERPRALQLFQWPESKLKEWAKSVVNVAAWEKETELRPNDANGFLNLGYEYFHAGRLTEAISVYKKASKLAPSWDSPWTALAGLYHNSGQYAEAESAFAEAQRVNPSAFIGFVAALKRGTKYPELKRRYPSIFK